MAHLANIRQSGDGALKGVPFFHDLTSGEIEAFNRMVVKKHYSREEVVLFEEDTANYMYIILSGKVRVVQMGTEGKERILAIHKRGDYFGELALFDGKTSPATVIAMEESYIGLLSKNDFDGLVFKYLIILYGVKEQRGVLIALKLTHKDIANYAAVSRETVTRLLNRFTNEGEIEILDKRYLLIKPAFM